MSRCLTFKSPGPPWYAAQCSFDAGHTGEHDFGTKEQAGASFYRETRRCCRFCHRPLLEGELLFCADEPCEVWSHEWQMTKIAARKERLRQVCFALRDLPRREPGAAVKFLDDTYARLRQLADETPQDILDRLAKELGCEPRQVCDRVIAMLEECKRGKD